MSFGWSRKILAMALALVMLLGCAAAEGTDAAVVAELTEAAETEALAAEAEAIAAEIEAAAEPVLLVSVNGEEIWSNNTEMNQMIDYYVSYYQNYYGYDISSDPSLKAAAMEWAMEGALYRQKAAELNVADMTDEQKAAQEAAAREEWEEILAYYAELIAGITETSTEEEKAAAKEQAKTYIEASFGYTEDSFVQEAVESARPSQLRINVLKAVMGDFEVTDEEVTKHFNELVEEDRQQFENNAAMFEYYTQFMGSSSFYTPEGYRGINHILLQVDPQLMENYTSLVARMEEQNQASDTEEATEGTETAEATEAPADSAEPTAEPTAEPEPVTQEMVDAARQAILDSVKPQVDEIMAKHKAGTPFADLIAEYGTDPGMLTEEAKEELYAGATFSELFAKYGNAMLGEDAKNGYMVHADSIRWDPAFTEGAMKLEKVGDVGEAVLGTDGIHLLHYLRDIPAGAVELTDELRSTLTEEIRSEKENEASNAMMEEWKKSAEIVYTAEGQLLVDAAKAEEAETVETTEATEETLAGDQ